MRFCLTSGVTAVIAFIALASASGLPPLGPIAVYTGELQLPVTLYGSDGTALEKGAFRVDLRSEKGGYVLAFSRGADMVKVVNGAAEAGENVTGTTPTLPLIGTVYLYESKVTNSEEEKRPADEKPDVTFIEHLGARPWKAALRAYGYPQPGPPEVLFVLEEQKLPGEWIRTDFKFFRTKPPQ